MKRFWPIFKLCAWIQDYRRRDPDCSIISYALARDEMVYLCAPSGIDLSRGVLTIGGRSFPIARYHGARDQLYASDADKYVFCLVPEAIRPWINAAFAVGTDIAPEWVLTDYPTHYVQIRKPASEQRFIFAGAKGRRVLLPRGKYVFSGFFAAHQASAALVISLISADGRLLYRGEAPFDGAYDGGKVTDGYRKIKLDFEASEDNCQLGVEMIYFAAADQRRPAIHPYLFFTECYVAKSASTSLDMREGPGAVISGNVDCIAEGDLFVSSIDARAFSRRASEIFLAYGSRKVPILKLNTSPIQVSVDKNDVLKISATKIRAISLYVDGEFTETRMVGRHKQSLLVNPRYHDGRVHHLMIRDASGAASLYEGNQTWPVASKPTLEAKSDNSVTAVLPLSGGGNGALHDANVRTTPIQFPAHPAPDVSIVIPAHNQFAVTYHCLCTLLIAANEATFEVILVDDGSIDETAKIGELITGIKRLRQDEAQGFVRACNWGASCARASYIVFLNNDAKPLDGWLDELLRVFRDHPEAGLVGSKLLNSSGALQEAGGIVFASGDTANFGHGDNPYDPKYCYVRQVDFVSSASMMTPRNVWEELNGFSRYLEPMSFEDADYALKVRESGREVWFTPFSRVVRSAGETSSADASLGMQYREINRPKFKQRWQSALAGCFSENTDIRLAKDGQVAGRVVFIDGDTPQPDRDAGSYAAVREIELVQSIGYKVTFAPQNMAWLGGYTEALQRRGVEVAYKPFYSSVADFIERHGPHTDAFYITRYQIGQRYIRHIREMAPQAKILLNLADLHFLREMRAALASDDREKLERSRHTRAAELDVIRSADVTLSYSAIERAIIVSHLMDDVKVVECPWVVDKAVDVPPFEARRDICFLGNFGHPPNEEGMRHFIDKVLPRLVERLPGLRLHIYGSGMRDKHKKMACSSVTVKGFVDKVGDAFDQHRIFVAPLISGAGIKGKVLAALSHGVPVVLSPLAAEGIGLQDGADCLIAEDIAGWIAAITRLYGDRELWSTISNNGLHLVEKRYSFSVGCLQMKAAFDRAGVGQSSGCTSAV